MANGSHYDASLRRVFRHPKKLSIARFFFGVERCMFGSNFPVDGMMSSYSRLWAAYSEITGNFSTSERQTLFCTNAERVYRI
jgi:predicted TIM-barrel fold metal-dependent hydrolase